MSSERTVDLDHLRHLWSLRNLHELGQKVSEAIPVAKQPAWAASIVYASRRHCPPIPEVDALWDIAREPTRRGEAHAAFSKVRASTLAEDRTHRRGPVYLALLDLAETVAKVIYNASGAGEKEPPYPFDEDCGYYLVGCFKHMLEQVGTPAVVAAGWALLEQWLNNSACGFDYPFGSTHLDPSWQTATVVSLARAIHEERAFDRLPILADALEDAGCTNADILTHCRQPGEHVRGCWVVDLLLRKE